MLLLPKTPSSTYPKTKNLKDQKSITFFSLSLTTKTFGFGLSGGGGRRRGEMASSLTIRESFKGKYSTCKTSAGIEFYKRNPFNFFLKSQSIFKRNPIKKNRLQFYMKNHKLETIFGKSHRSSMILKILENFSNLSKIYP